MEEVKITLFGKDYGLPIYHENIFCINRNGNFIVVSIPEYFSVFFRTDHDAHDGSLVFDYYFEFNEIKEIQNLLEDYICNVKNYLKILSSSIEFTYGEELENYSAMKEII